ncbi:MAG: cytochrome c biogenesis CcdA family protein [Actinomycetota bacterium]
MSDRPPDSIRPDRVRVGIWVSATLLVLGVALAGAVLAPRAPLVLVEALSSRTAKLLRSTGTALGLGYAFVAGMVAAVNPCGFALLPAWLGAYLSDRAEAGGTGAVRHSILVALSLTGGVIGLFMVVGAVAAGVSGSFVVAFPWVGLGLGVLLTAVGGGVLAGRSLHLSLAEGWASRLARGAGAPSARSYARYGLVYGLASLSCTLPAFLAVITTSLLAGGYLMAFLQFAMFGVGMAAVLAGMTVLVGLMSRSAPAALRRFSRHAVRASGILLLLAGGYLVYYWLSVWPLLRRAS